MNSNEILKSLIRPVRDVTYIVTGFLYDFYRYLRFSGWVQKSRLSVRDYKAAKIYHRLEKSMSFRNRNSSSGWGATSDLVAHLMKYNKHNREFTFHERVAIKVLGDFIEATPSNAMQVAPRQVIEFWEQYKIYSSEIGGVIEKSYESLQGGKLSQPEDFFLTRHSVRDFDTKSVSIEDIERAISLALNTPSVCNRQSSYVYSLTSRTEIDKALSLQNGNRGFGHEVPCLLILCSDVSAFDTASERYQQWIDGGMFSMSIVWALHSLGLSSCCLNWSKGPLDDLKLRKIVNIRNEHTVLMMMAVGIPRESIKVCFSARKDVEDFFESIG